MTKRTTVYETMCDLCKKRYDQTHRTGSYTMDISIVCTHERERSKREDYVYCTVCETFSREPELGVGHYCHKCRI